MALNRPKMGSSKKGGFKYRARTAEQVKNRASQSGGSRDAFVQDDVKLFVPKTGDHSIRILPPTWDDADHFGLDVFVHYGIGVDGSAYLCLHKMKGEDCPLCEERGRAEKEGEEELAAALKPTKRVGVYVIDRNNEKEGPKLWTMPWTFDRDMCAQAVDKKTGEVYNLDDPEEGYDVSFTIEGQGQTKKYIGIQIDRRPSPLSDDEDMAEEWLEFIQSHPIPEILNYFEPEALEKAVSGGVRLRDNKDGKDKAKPAAKGKVEERPRRGKKDEVDEQDEDLKRLEQGKGKRSKKKSFDVDDYDWDTVHEMDEDELAELIEEAELDPDDIDFDDDVADQVCELLEIEQPKKKASGLKDRMAKLRGGR